MHIGNLYIYVGRELGHSSKLNIIQEPDLIFRILNLQCECLQLRVSGGVHVCVRARGEIAAADVGPRDAVVQTGIGKVGPKEEKEEA